MKSVDIRIVLTLIVLLFLSAPATADVAVLVRITDFSVTLQRVERSESIESLGQDQSDAIIKRLAAPLDANNKANSGNSLVVEWFDAAGTLVHRESRADPRFVHAPGGEDVVLPEAIVLMRAPASAVLVRVRPRGFVDFTNFNV